MRTLREAVEAVASALDGYPGNEDGAVALRERLADVPETEQGVWCTPVSDYSNIEVTLCDGRVYLCGDDPVGQYDPQRLDGGEFVEVDQDEYLAAIRAVSDPDAPS